MYFFLNIYYVLSLILNYHCSSAMSVFCVNKDIINLFEQCSLKYEVAEY